MSSILLRAFALLRYDAPRCIANTMLLALYVKTAPGLEIVSLFNVLFVGFGSVPAIALSGVNIVVSIALA